jgi:hypothetical protein
MTFTQALLQAKNVSLEELGALVIMLQNATPDGAIVAKDTELYSQYCRLFGRRPARDDFAKYKQSLLAKRMIPSETAIYPANGGEAVSSGDLLAQVREAIQETRQAMHVVRPPRNRDHERVFAALKAVDALEAAVKQRKKQLESVLDGNPLLASGMKLHQYVNEWDYTIVKKWITDHSVEHVISTLCRLYVEGAIDRVRADCRTFDELRTRLRQYLMAAFSGRAAQFKDGYERESIHD